MFFPRPHPPPLKQRIQENFGGEGCVTLIVVMVSWVCAYVQTHHIICIKYLQILHIHYTSIKLFLTMPWLKTSVYALTISVGQASWCDPAGPLVQSVSRVCDPHVRWGCHLVKARRGWVGGSAPGSLIRLLAGFSPLPAAGPRASVSHGPQAGGPLLCLPSGHAAVSNMAANFHPRV